MGYKRDRDREGFQGSMDRVDKAQMMVLEAVVFALLMIISILFVYQLSPSSFFYKSAPTNQLSIMASDILRSIGNKNASISGYQNLLAQLIGENDIDELTYLINQSLPDFAYYNVYVGNGSSYTVLYSDEDIIGGKFGEVSRGFYVVYIGKDITGKDGVTVEGDVFEVVLEVWRI